jgi:hypothetical protein
MGQGALGADLEMGVADASGDHHTVVTSFSGW